MLFIFIGIILLLTSPVSAEDWDTVEKTMFGTLLTMKAIDCLQTSDIYDHPDKYYEINPIINWGVEEFGKKFIPIYFVGSSYLSYLITDKVFPKYKKETLGILNTIQLGVIYYNHTAGLSLSFRF